MVEAQIRQVHVPVPRPWLVVGTVCIGAFMGQLDASIVTLALPTIEEAFHVSLAATVWVSLSYLLTLAGLVVAFGRLADMLGRKLMYTVGFIVFIVGSALCGLSGSLAVLVAARVVQALGAAMLQANSVALITQAVPRGLLGRAVGIQGTAQAVGLSVGPAVGGVLIAHLGWQWIFFINVPAGIIGTVLAILLLPRDEQTGAREPFAYRAVLTLLAAVAAMLYGLTYANDWGWTSPRTLITFVVALFLLLAFSFSEQRAAAPLLDFRLFAHPVFRAGIVAAMLSYSVLFGALFVLPFLFERVEGRSPAATGMLLALVPLGLGVVAPVSGLWADRVGSRAPMTVGMLLAFVSLLGLAANASRDALPMTIALLVLFGVGLGLFTPANNSAIMGSAPRDRLGVAGGLLNMIRGLGTSAGVAVTGAALAHTLTALLGYPIRETSQAPPAALHEAIQSSMVLLAGVAAGAALISIVRGPEDRAAQPPARRNGVMKTSHVR